jgi:hypothetical protein
MKYKLNINIKTFHVGSECEKIIFSFKIIALGLSTIYIFDTYIFDTYIFDISYLKKQSYGLF